MKILYTNIHHGNGGGHVTYIMSLLQKLGETNELWLGTPAESRLYRYAQKLGNVRLLDMRFTSRIGSLAFEVRALRRLLERERFDIVHVSASADHRHFMLARLGLARAPKIVWTRHNDRPVNSFGHRLRSRFGTDHVIAVSDFVGQGLAQSPYSSVPATVIRHGINTACYAPVCSNERLRLREQWFGQHHARLIVLGSVGGTDLEKGWLDLVQAVSMLPPEQAKRFRIMVAGDFPDDAQMRRLRALGMQQQCVFPGLVDNVRTVLGACDAGFVLSYFEALSYACRETMAMGLPTLITDAGGLPENLQHGQQGWIVPVKKPAAIVPVLQAMLEAPEKLLNMGVQARRYSVACFGLDQFAQCTSQVYQRTLGLI